MEEVTEKNTLVTEETDNPDRKARKFRFIPDASMIRRIKIAVIVLLSLINVSGIMILIPGTPLHHRLFPVYRNPYEKTEVRFTGRNGEGTIILYHEPGDEFSGLTYTITPSKNLYNGDKVIIRAENVAGYRWSPAEAAVIVSGLADRVTSIAEITDTALVPIHYNTEIMIGLEWDRILEAGGIQSYATKPYKLMFFSENDQEAGRNYLYDIYRTDVVKKDGSAMTVYEAFQYRGLRTQKDQTVAFRYGSLMNYNIGSKYDLGAETSFSGWLEAEKLEEDLKILHQDLELEEK